MKHEIISGQSLASDFTTDWVPITMAGPETFGKVLTAKSLQIIYQDAGATADGEIIIEATSDELAASAGDTISVNTDSNADDADMFVLYPFFEFIRISYSANSTSTGNVRAILYFDQ